MPAIEPHQYAVARRSRRIWFTMPIRISFYSSETLIWTEESFTLILNAHGALILLQHEITPGTLLTLSDLKSDSHRRCRVVMLGARHSGSCEVGIELLEPCAGFWSVPNPPADWAAHGYSSTPPHAQPMAPVKPLR